MFTKLWAPMRCPPSCRRERPIYGAAGPGRSDTEGSIMASKSPHFCLQPSCHNLTNNAYCEEHAPLHMTYADNRASASERGYDAKWSRFSKRYLSQPEHQFCALHISPNCKGIAECVDHINPLRGKDDPRKYDQSNLQPACLACNTLKGKQTIRGAWVYGEREDDT